MKNFNYKPLTAAEMNFLIGYKPADEHFTSVQEIHEVSNNLNLASYEHTNQLQELRNSVIGYYSFLMGNVRERVYAFMASMQSVTAVIDNQIYRCSYMH